MDILEVLEPWPVWVADNPRHSVPSRYSFSMCSYYLVDYWDEYQGYLAIGDSSENDGHADR